RWATHGAPTRANAHPHTDCKRRIALAHNGIIENYKELRRILERKGHRFASETDTEVIAHCVEDELRGLQRSANGDQMSEAFRLTLNRLRGAYAIALIDKERPSSIYFARLGSPLVVGIGDGEQFVASDPAALVGRAKKVIYVGERQWGKIGDGEISLTPKTHIIEPLEWNTDAARKGKFPFFMMKEIFEAPDTVRAAQMGRLMTNGGFVKLGGLESVAHKLRAMKRLKIIACGTSYYAGLIGERLIETFAHIPVEAHIGSEFRYREEPVERGTVCLFISQSGETADTIASLRKAKENGLLTLGLVNVVGSAIARETDAGVYNHAGPEIGVATTKAFISQLTVLGMMAMFFAQLRKIPLPPGAVNELGGIADKVKAVLANAGDVERIAKRYAAYENFLYVGRGYHAVTALEGALKLKEISYAHAEGYAAGEMKHGPIALISKTFPTVAIIPQNDAYVKTYSNLQEIRARGGPIFAIATEGDANIRDAADDVFFIPPTKEWLEPLLAIIPLQLFAYYIAVGRGYDVDKPRNLAKSVTVE
ncbi:MAG: glutamine--fructose-6-phosphate transaminase (isomerizing), partial [Candidatus Liptonbacteria bacterium]|nr:glutamine--fructose-6-phosphate transaminase (isomerizing) [Candidatus Liptonbacteria bacterium]